MAEPLHILLAEDDEMFGNILRDYLVLNGHNVMLCRNGEEARSEFVRNDYDLIITDVMMPVKDGFTFVNELRKINKIVPVIYLTARNQKEDIVRGYKSGADDYITKPFDSEVLLLKIQAVTSRHRNSVSNHTPEQIAIGNYVFIPAERVLQLDENRERLSPRESALLSLLLSRKNELVDRSVILKEIWGDDSYFNNRSLDVYITKLRKRLSADSSVQIESIYGGGVRIVLK
jgi:two-component system, OmpR family, response regulator